LNRDLAALKGRKVETDASVEFAVRGILADVKAEGDAAVRRYAAELDGFTGSELLVSEAEIKAALHAVGEDFLALLQRARNNICEFHANQMEASWSMYRDNGAMLGQIVRPLGRVALYVPGGTASYPSSVLMNAIPAVLAGVEEIVMFTPVKRDGKVADVILAAAATSGVHTIYKVGGAQAIAAAAYGTETIGKVDKIVGPGNAYVATAKRLVYGEVGIDMIAGPSEVLIIADEGANPKYIAADMLGQAEHDRLASAILITTSEKVRGETEAELGRQMALLDRREIAEASLSRYGAAILVGDLEEAFALSNELAPEHLEIMTENPMEHLPKVQNAGSIFLGEHTPEALGDYMSGTNHVLPTNGTARFYSPLGVQDFIKRSSFSFYPRSALESLAADVVRFAELEGLGAHAQSVKVRFEEGE